MDPSLETVAGQSRLVATLKRLGALQSARVEEAFRVVPRHLFLPEAQWVEAYEDRTVVTKRRGDVILSSSSQPSLMAAMLEQLQPGPGHRILEIGAGTGFNSALMARIVGTAGCVVTLDLDLDIVDQARRNLARAGYERLIVCCRDGSLGYPELAPFDRIILTVGARDLAPRWLEQLKPGGRMVIPLSLGPVVQLSVAFERQEDGGLISRSVSHCDFLPLRGAMDSGSAPTTLSLDPSGQLQVQAQMASSLEPERLLQSLQAPSRVIGSLRLRPQELTAFDFWLRLEEPRWCMLIGRGPWARPGRMPGLFGVAGQLCMTGGLASTGGFCLLAPAPGSPAEASFLRADGAGGSVDLVVRQYGEDDGEATRLLDLLARWRTCGSPRPESLRITVPPPGAAAPPQPATGRRFALSWE